jgi:hypothetical protein
MEKHPNPTTSPEEKQTAAPTAAPPEYAEAAAPTTWTAIVHNFIRHSRWNKKVHIRAAGVDRYTLAPAKKEARLWVHAGASTDNAPLGFLDFPSSHNAFRLNFHNSNTNTNTNDQGSPSGAKNFDFTDVKSRIGHPHSGSFSFKTAISGTQREYEWKNTSQGREAKEPVVYELSAGALRQRTATLTVYKKGKGATGIRWCFLPATELEQALLVLSAAGVIFRLSHQGVYKEDEGPRGRWVFATMWYSALLGMAAMG